MTAKNPNKIRNWERCIVEPGSFFDLRNKYEKALIEHAVTATNGNHKAAAKMLGMNRTTLVEVRRRLGLPVLPATKKKETTNGNA
jgi:DNA-binding NtrC family response regulator